ncbi:MAG TPA: AsmA-like C-terminal region-containing protein, partial [Bacteroidia bacterium]|nr:AsmA-like C-terminal region-containing protein [Bacteroidia bacterium]
RMNLMGGSMLLNGSYSTQDPAVPVVDFDMNITDFDIQQTFKTFNTVQKLAPVGQYTTGKFSTKLKYKSNLGPDMMPLMNTINGQGTLSTKQVEINGFAPLKKLDEALKINKFSKVTMSDLNLVSYKIENGRVSTDPFDFKAGKATGKMGGSTGIDQTINYVMDLAIPRDEFGPANTALNGLVSQANSKGVPVQLGDVVNVAAIFGGTVTNPTVSTNLKQAGTNLMDQLKDNLTNVVTQKVDSVKNVAVNKACDEAQKQLDQAVKAAADAKAAAYKAADDAKTAAYAEADKTEKSYKNPLEKAAKKALADQMRKTADDKNKQAKDAADKAERDADAKAQADKDAKCK